MSWQETAKMTKTQKEEILELIKKLGWSVEEYEAGLMWKLEDSLWFQAIAMISGLEWMHKNPNSWKLNMVK